MLHDLRAAWRSLAKSPGFVVIAVLALGLGLGLSTVMFGVIDAVLRPQSGFKYADRLYWVSPHISIRAGSFTSADLHTILRKQTHSFDAFIPINFGRAHGEVGAEVRELDVRAVPPRYFDAYGVRFRLGRPFTTADPEAVAVVSYDAWRILSAEHRSLEGAYVSIEDQRYRVVGVLEKGTHGLWADVPLRAGEDTGRAVTQTLRLAAGVTTQQAQAELDALARVLTARFGWPSAPWSLHLHLLYEHREEIGDIRKAMVAAALAVLLIACVNLAHLMLARGLAKRRELAVRMALGAGRVAAVRLMLAEGLLIMLGGIALGGVGALWGSSFAQSLMPPEISWLESIRFQLSWRVFALGAVAAGISGVLFGLLPAVRVALAVDLTDPLKSDSGTTTGQAHWRYSPLVIAEVALALALMMGGGLLLRSVHQLRATSLGFEPEALVRADIGTDWGERRVGNRTEVTTIDWAQALAVVRGVPGVQDAAIEGASRTHGGAVTAEMTGDSTRLLLMLDYPVVSPSYLQVYGLPILKGRDFSAGDIVGNGVAILSSVAAARLYPKGNAVGRMLKLGSPRAQAPWIPIVGVARTPITPWEESGMAGGKPVFWVVQPPGKWWSATIFVRAPTRSPALLVDLRRALRSVPLTRTVSVEPFTWERDAEIASRAFLSSIFVAMGAVGLGLAALGLYGVLSYAVGRRMREFAVRVALGAEPRMLFRMVMHDGLVMLLAGTGIGAFVALGSSYLFYAVLIGVYPTDALSLVAAEAVLLIVGLAAALAPARRAVRASPLDILRAV